VKLSLDEVLQATGGELVGRAQGAETLFEAVTTDSRSALAGCLFVALKGERFDGHDFVAQAAAAGAAGVLVDHGEIPEGVLVVQVGETLEALGLLARHVRRKIGFRLGAITGSFGKTTTKEMAAAMLESAGRKTLRTPGNLNNLIGLPLTLLGAGGDESDAVVELGINVPGDMARLAEICEPDAALITGVGEAHTEGLGSVEGVAAEKLGIGAGLGRREAAGTLLLPYGQRLLQPESSRHIRVVTFGWTPQADVVGSDWTSEGETGSRFQVDGREIQVPWPGKHNADNALAAWALIRAMGAADEVGDDPLATLAVDPLRGHVCNGPNGSRLLVDCYNANPRAVAAALDTLTELAGDARKLAVLGEMKELGHLDEASHREMGRAAVEAGVEQLFLLGESTRFTADEAVKAGLPPDAVQWFNKRESLIRRLLESARSGSASWLSRYVALNRRRQAAKSGMADAL
jgi:UDP-N-acetylmuramoyl-tripeptide--D-alanyl-D-alanine ligase